MSTVARYLRNSALAVLTTLCTLTAHAGVPGEDRVAAAKSLLALEVKGDFAAVEAKVAPNSRRSLSLNVLRSRWEGIVKRGGPLKSVAESKQQKVNQYDMVITTCKFTKGDVDSKIVFDTNGQVISFFFVASPGSKLPPERSAPGGPPRGFGGPGGGRGPGGPGGPGGPPHN
jgi:hypothetical protein